MRINMRTETIKDYSAIAEVNLLAFRDSDQCFVGEVAMVDTLRHRPDYDPELALVAHDA